MSKKIWIKPKSIRPGVFKGGYFVTLDSRFPNREYNIYYTGNTDASGQAIEVELIKRHRKGIIEISIISDNYPSLCLVPVSIECFPKPMVFL